ncbi:enoyl-CoA hydratase/isomerase family protein [Paraferrimonas sp. SM1919]|uniref:enoyl-CoA hydratase/isomerase family protein n=1 Tax=Paraferrimonas sp. SM1919 TaxID=2662263 RepID=UPI0013D3BFDD|nr:enoyl-CoA hydratase/isomerase family protein [Paraferrimonas sp. SM1919]
MSESCLITYQVIKTHSQHHIGVASLNNTTRLNALNYQMVCDLKNKLLAWQNDPKIVMVVINSTIEKALCAGGDIRAIYQAKVNGEEVATAAYQYFSAEYQMDYLIHKFQKPILVWGAGIVFGGGMGVLQGASHRVVTPSSKLAMPELSIGLFPDVGATYFLNKLPGKTGLLLSMTGYLANAADAIYLGLADAYLGDEQFEPLLDMLANRAWQAESLKDHDILDNALKTMQNVRGKMVAASLIAEHQSEIDTLFAGQFKQVMSKLRKLPPWLADYQENVDNASLISMAIAHYQQNFAKATLEQCLNWELKVATHCAQYGDFMEGVRALLVDKDRTPNWRYKQLDEINTTTLSQFV